MLSSRQAKRLLGKFDVSLFAQFRSLLRRLFVWRLKSEDPNVVVLNMDPMVMDNDAARKRKGVQQTYKNIKGFLPLQVSWGPYLVDAILRGGSKNGNHGNTVLNTLRWLIRLIRDCLGEEITIVVLMDAGFRGRKIFTGLGEMDASYITTGKLYEDISTHVDCLSRALWNSYSNGDVKWGDRRASWSRFRRLLLLRRTPQEDGQTYLPLCGRKPLSTPT